MLHSHLDHLLHKLPDWAFPPVLMAVATSLWSAAQGVNWLGLLGLCVSVGWMRLGYLRHQLQREQFETTRLPAP